MSSNRRTTMLRAPAPAASMLLLCLACGAAPTNSHRSVATAAAAATAATPENVAIPAGAKPGTSTPEAIPPLGACRLGTTTWEVGTVRLRLTADGPIYATINKPSRLLASLSDGPSPATLVAEVTAADGAVLRGLLAVADVDLTPTAPLLVANAMVPLATHPLRVVAVHGAAAELDVTAPAAAVTLKAGAKGEVACSYLGVSPTTFPPLEKTPFRPIGAAALRPGSVTVFSDAGLSKPVASIEVTPSIPYAALLAQEGIARRVALRIDDVAYVGWVPTSLAPDYTESVQSGAWGATAEPRGTSVRDTSVAGWPTVTCLNATPIFAEAGGQQRQIGILPAGHRVQVGPERTGMQDVALPGSDFLVGDAGRLFVRAGMCGAK